MRSGGSESAVPIRRVLAVCSRTPPSATRPSGAVGRGYCQAQQGRPVRVSVRRGPTRPRDPVAVRLATSTSQPLNRKHGLWHIVGRCLAELAVSRSAASRARFPARRSGPAPPPRRREPGVRAIVLSDAGTSTGACRRPHTRWDQRPFLRGRCCAAGFATQMCRSVTPTQGRGSRAASSSTLRERHWLRAFCRTHRSCAGFRRAALTSRRPTPLCCMRVTRSWT